MRFRSTSATLAFGLLVSVVVTGCHTQDSDRKTIRTSQSVGRGNPIRRVVSLYSQKPWLNLDLAGDRDPEGIHYRVFLDSGKNQGELRDGELRIELYLITKTFEGKVERRLFSDYILPTSGVLQVKSHILGMGYHLHLRWAEKEIAGNEIEIITSFKDPTGGITRAATKRIYVPSYAP